MAVEITNDTVVKIIVRRGQESERLKVILSEGEVGYTVDQARLYVGDGVTPGGHVVGQRNFGPVPVPGEYIPFLRDGDLIYNSNTKDFLSYQKGAGLYSLQPQPYAGSIERGYTGEFRVAAALLGPAFSLAYRDSGTITPSSITKTYNQIDFDSRYMSLSAPYGSVYIGNVHRRTVTNNLSAKLNVQENIFVNSNSNSYQLQMYGYNAKALGTTIDAISGNFHIRGTDDLTLRAGRLSFTEQPQFTITQGGFIALNPTAPFQTYPNAGLKVYGITRHHDDTFVDGMLSATEILADDGTINNNFTIHGNLSVLGTTTYLDTTVTTTSALSVLNYNENMCAMLVRQGSPTANQTLARFESSAGNNPVVSIKDGPYFGFNTDPQQTFIQGSDTANFCVSGSFFISPNPQVTNSRVIIRTGLAGSINLQCAGNKVVLNNDQRGLELTGNFKATGNSEIQGNETVLGNMTVYGTTTLGNAAEDSVVANGIVTATSNVSIYGTTTCYSPVTIQSSLDVRETSYLGADVADQCIVTGTLITRGAGTTNIGGNLTVAGPSEFTGAVRVKNNITIDNTMYAGQGRVYGNMVVDAQIQANTGSITGLLQSGSLTSMGNVSLGSSVNAVTVNGNLNATTGRITSLNLTVNNLATINSLGVNTTANIAGATTIGGAVTIASTANISGATTIGGICSIAGSTGIGGAVTIAGATGISGALATESSTRFGYNGGNSPCIIHGDTTVNGYLNVKYDVTAYSTSDIKLKKNIRCIDSALDKVEKLRGVNFEWNENSEVFTGKDIGLIAQEVENILPEIVVTRDTGYKAIRYEKVIPLLVEAIKELRKKIKE